ncbi:MAG TPA: T9SS type A sorting domain-containing protein, partial [Bacteroidales bacterium]|nr:T9SS type A sorting domain-containing protein [Bacteroidales bacterium]
LNLYKDSLIIEVSTNCGLSFDKILFAEGGENLATVEGNSNFRFYKPKEDSEFDTINISLNEFKGEKLIVRFRTKNDNGSVLYIDEMKIGVLDNSSIFSNKIVVQEPEIYPNPASDIIFVKIYERKEIVEIFDLTGRLVLNQEIYGEISEIKLGDLTEGVYFIHFINSGKTKKLIKK